MEKISSFERVVGNISETEKKQILQDSEERFNDQVFKEMKDKEREKTPEELQIISLANKATNEIRRKYGLEDFDIPPDNIHVVTKEAWPREKGVAFYNSMMQGIAIREQSAKIVFMKKIFHEMLHFKSYNALQITSGENPEFDEYRVGLTVHTRDGKKMYFTNLNEAVTEEMTKKFATKLFDNSLFTKESKQTKNIMIKYPGSVTASGEPLFSDDTFYAKIEDKESWSETVGHKSDLQEKPKKMITKVFTHQQERKILNTMIDKIYERNSEKFQTRDEVFEVFAKGMMTGNILPAGRLIEKTFGSSTLRRIGELDQNIQAQETFVNSL